MKMLMLLLIVASSMAIGNPSEKTTRSDSIKSPFTISISSKSDFALGAPVEVRIRLTNTSDHEINGSTGNIRGFCDAYLYDVRDESGLKVKQKQIDATHQGSAESIMLGPGKSRDEVTRITEAYDLWPGKYTIQLSMPASNDSGAAIIKSNKILITVNP